MFGFIFDANTVKEVCDIFLTEENDMTIGDRGAAWVQAALD